MLRIRTKLGALLIALIAGGWIAYGDPTPGVRSVEDVKRMVTPSLVAIGNGSMGPETLSLDEATAIARLSNPRLLAARAEIETAEGERIEAGLWENPELEIYSEEIPVDSGGISAAKNMVGVSQTVPFPGKKALERKAADLGIEQSRYEYRATELEVIRDVKIAFYRVLASQRSVEIFEQLSSLSQSLATTADKRLQAGESPAQELLRAEIEWQRASTEAEKSRGELSEARQELAAILGRPDLQHASISGKLSAERADVLSSHAHRDALQHYPRMKQAHLVVEVAEAMHNRARKAPLPDVTLEVAFGSRDSEPEGSENLAELSVSLPLPLIDRGQGSSRIAKGRLALAQARLVETEQELLRQYGSAMSRLETATKRVDSYRDGILPKIDKALSLMQRGFQEGKFSFIDLLDTQRTVAETRLNYQEALFELNAAEATLDSLLAHDHMNQEER